MLYGLPDIYVLQKIIHNGVWWVFDTDTFPPSSLLTFPHHGGDDDDDDDDDYY